MERYVNNYYPTVDQMAIDGGVVGVNDVHMDRWTPFVLRSDYDALHKQLTDAQATIAALRAEVKDLKEWLAAYKQSIELAQSSLTQRTAELEAAKAESNAYYEKAIQFEHELYGDPINNVGIVHVAQGLKKERADLQAELERVRGELERAEAGYFVAERDLQGMNNKYDELRTLIAALPKVEGEITANRVCTIMMHGLYCEEFTKLLQHRQGME